mmetsp:Transcript_2073/g.3163  ORF Transcript_2073/g.3163 Transcript_2073/m.3163 type:complete len:259 (-) Transcript_2073:1977-2753(-)
MRMVQLVDVHAHLYQHAFDEDLGAVVKRAADIGVTAILCVSETASDAGRILELSQQYPIIKPCAGLHPCNVTAQEAEDILSFIKSNHDRLVAIGEVGLDFCPWNAKTDSEKEFQRDVLRKQAFLSNEFDLPLNVHSRQAGHHAISLLKEVGAKRVLLHAFDGRPAAAQQGIDAGYFFSIPPSVVRSPNQQRLVEKLPLSNMLLESDSPSLGPEKEGRNEPANLLRTVEMIAAIKNVSADHVAEITTANAVKLFPLAFR